MKDNLLEAGIDCLFGADPLNTGSKGIVWIGDKLLMYRRDGNTVKYPYCIDLPGGGPEDGETPFETCQREVREEFGLGVEPKHLVDGGKFASLEIPGRTAYFFVLKYPASAVDDIRFGDEGVEYMLMTPDEYAAHTDVSWPYIHARARTFLG